MLEVVVAGDDGEEFLFGEKDGGEEELVPDREGDDETNGEEARPGEGDDDAGEDTPFAGTVDAGGVFEVGRELDHIGAEEERWQGRIDGDVDDGQTEEVVDEVKPLPEEEEGDEEELQGETGNRPGGRA